MCFFFLKTFKVVGNIIARSMLRRVKCAWGVMMPLIALIMRAKEKEKWKGNQSPSPPGATLYCPTYDTSIEFTYVQIHPCNRSGAKTPKACHAHVCFT